MVELVVASRVAVVGERLRGELVGLTEPAEVALVRVERCPAGTLPVSISSCVVGPASCRSLSGVTRRGAPTSGSGTGAIRRFGTTSCFGSIRRASSSSRVGAGTHSRSISPLGCHPGWRATSSRGGTRSRPNAVSAHDQTSGP
jgi:hypothetical protein